MAARGVLVVVEGVAAMSEASDTVSDPAHQRTYSSNWVSRMTVSGLP